jgi:hypothetical protein
MTASEPASADDLRYQAASLAFTMLRFADGAAHEGKYSTPPGVPRTGTECYIFAPSWRRILNADVPRFLAEVSPAIVAPTTTRGIATLILLDELQGERRAWGQKTLDNQLAGLANMLQQLELDDDSRVLLQFDDEEHWYPMSVVRAWCTTFGVGGVGWNMTSYADDDRARARLILFRGDGEMSWGSSCQWRPRDT